MLPSTRSSLGSLNNTGPCRLRRRVGRFPTHATARLMETWAYGQDVVDAFGIERSATSRLKHIAHLGVRTRGYSYTQHGLTPPADAVRVELRVRTGHCGHGVSRRRPTT
jgi:hypothetical protein